MRDDVSAYQRRLVRKQARFLKYIASGLTTAEIATRELVPPTSVLRFIGAMQAEYGARNRAQLIHIAWQRGLLKR